VRLEGWKSWRVVVLAVCAGACLGLIFRYLLSSPTVSSSHVKAMVTIAPIVSIGFLAVVPLAMGYLSVAEYFRATPIEEVREYKWFFLPWGAVTLSMTIAVLLKWEGRICILFALPIMFVFSILGGFAARMVWGKLGPRSPGRVSAFAVPLVLLLIEAHVPDPYQIRTVETEELIRAPASVVWNNIKSVRLIEPQELSRSWIERAGFPRPLAATLSHEGIGGVREAGFTGGLLFTETVNRWEPERNLRFSIRANTESIPKSTLDEHVMIGGDVFDVLDGEYTLEERPDGVLLRLSSRERLSTHVNPYAGQWTDAVMKAIQEQILGVIQKRAESNSARSQQVQAIRGVNEQPQVPPLVAVGDSSK
jgi:hypothetical protein